MDSTDHKKKIFVLRLAKPGNFIFTLCVTQIYGLHIRRKCAPFANNRANINGICGFHTSDFLFTLFTWVCTLIFPCETAPLIFPRETAPLIFIHETAPFIFIQETLSASIGRSMTCLYIILQSSWKRPTEDDMQYHSIHRNKIKNTDVDTEENHQNIHFYRSWMQSIHTFYNIHSVQTERNPSIHICNVVHTR